MLGFSRAHTSRQELCGLPSPPVHGLVCDTWEVRRENLAHKVRHNSQKQAVIRRTSSISIDGTGSATSPASMHRVGFMHVGMGKVPE